MQINSVTDSIRVCMEPTLYEAINYRHRVAGNVLKRFPPGGHDIDDFGNPIIPADLRLNCSEEREAQSDIQSLVTDIYTLNGATRKLLLEKRDRLCDELAKFQELGNDEILTHARRPDNSNKPTIEGKETKKQNDEPLSFNLDMSPQAQAGRTYLNEKRRALNQMYLVTPFTPMLGMAGIAMAGPPYSIIILNALGLIHEEEEVRFGTICFFDGQVSSERSRYFTNITNNTPDIFKPGNKYFANETISNLAFIATSLNRKRFGVYDRSEKVRSKAEDVQLNALKAISEIKKQDELN